MKEIKELTGLYSLTKTIGVELKPVGKTQELVEAKKLIEQDDQRAEDYKIVKDIIDRYHKDFIDKCLNCVKIKKDDLEKYVSLAENSNRDAEDFDNIKTKMRNQITEAFRKNSLFTNLFKKNLIKEYLPAFVSEEEKSVVNKFSKFTTYFDAFNDNRKNLYSGDAKSGTIAYRLIHENLPIFLDNIASFNIISETGVNEYFSGIETEFTDTLEGKRLTELFQIDFFNNTLTQKKIDNYNYIVGAVNKAVNLYKQQHKTVRVPLLKTLHKMILSERVTPSWLPERFESDEEMLTALAEKCDASNAVTATLTAAGWASGQQTLTIAGLGATQNGVIGLSQSITDEQLSAASEAEMYICGQAAGSVTIAANGSVPTCDIPVVIILLG
jgi:CRISPR-associated protein Cpf1